MPKIPATCRFILASGATCGRLAKRDGHLCSYHQKSVANLARLRQGFQHRAKCHASVPGQFDRTSAQVFHDLDLPNLQDIDAIQSTLPTLVRALCLQQIDRSNATKIFYALQVATQTMREARL